MLDPDTARTLLVIYLILGFIAWTLLCLFLVMGIMAFSRWIDLVPTLRAWLKRPPNRPPP